LLEIKPDFAITLLCRRLEGKHRKIRQDLSELVR